MPQMSPMRCAMTIFMLWSMILMFMIMSSHMINNYLKKMKTKWPNKNVQ